MARINIEECWWSDPRRDYLRRLLGDDVQDQIAIRAWRLAQEFWSKGKLIPWHTYCTLEGAEVLVKSGLARLHEADEPNSKQIEANASNLNECFVYVRGSSEYLSWTRDRREAAKSGGLKSADARRRNSQANAKQTEANATKRNQTQPSYSSSVSFSKKEESIGATAIAVAPKSQLPEIPKKKAAHPEIGRFIGTYVKAFQEKYQTRPDLRGKVQGQINHYLADVPIDRACDLIQTYLQMEEPWFKTKCHDFGTFLENQNKVSIALDTGRDSNQTDWSKVFEGEPGYET
jgi:hypothetical protein